MKQSWTDAEFEVISGPNHAPPVRWQPKPREFDIINALRWCYLGTLGFGVLVTVIVGVLGGDIDTRDEVRTADYRLKPGPQADGTVAVAPVD